MKESPRQERNIRVGMVGSGLMANSHSRAMMRSRLVSTGLRAFEFCSLTSRNSRTSKLMSEAYGWTTTSTDWHEVTRASDIDLIFICTPEDSHHAIAMDALTHGKAVFCEKPLAVTANQAREMSFLAEQSELTNVTGFVLRGWPALRSAKDIMTSAKLGQVLSIRGKYFIDSRTLPESALRGLGSHVLDGMMFLSGEIESVCARQTLSRPDAAFDTETTALLRFSRGHSGILETNSRVAGRSLDMSIEVICDRGTLRVSSQARETVEVVQVDQGLLPDTAVRKTYMDQDPQPLAPFRGAGFGFDDLLTAQAVRLAAAMNGAPSELASFRDGWHVAAVSDAIEESCATQRWVTVRVA